MFYFVSKAKCAKVFQVEGNIIPKIHCIRTKECLPPLQTLYKAFNRMNMGITRGRDPRVRGTGSLGTGPQDVWKPPGPGCKNTRSFFLKRRKKELSAQKKKNSIFVCVRSSVILCTCLSYGLG